MFWTVSPSAVYKTIQQSTTGNYRLWLVDILYGKVLSFYTKNWLVIKHWIRTPSIHSCDCSTTCTALQYFYKLFLYCRFINKKHFLSLLFRRTNSIYFIFYQCVHHNSPKHIIVIRDCGIGFYVDVSRGK